MKDFRNVPLQFDDLSQIVSNLEKFYKDEGKIVAAKIPPQDITDGILNISLAEARVGKIIIDPGGSSRVKKTKLQAIVESYSPPNKIYDAIQIQTPVIINSEVKISKFVEKINLGYIIKDYYIAVRICIY